MFNMKNLKNFQEQSSVALWLVMVLIIVLKEKVQVQVDVQPEKFVQAVKCIPYTGPGGGGGGGNPGGPSYTCICPWGTFVQNEPCAGPPYYCIQG
jgi:hypothetical protein